MKMTRLRTVLSVGVVTVVALGCQPAPAPEPPPEVAEAPPLEVDLEGTSWRAESIAGQPVAEGVASTLVFETEERVAGNGGCNDFFGSWGIDGDAIAFGHMGASMMMCSEPQMLHEKAFMEALTVAERFELRDGKLLIFSEGAAEPTVLVAHAAPAGSPDEG
jgi:heat shock protein HslJ